MLYYKDVRRLFIMKNKYNSKGTPGFIKSLLIGSAVIAAAFAVASFTIALIIYNTDDPTSKTALLSIIAFVISGAVGAFINTKLFGQRNNALPYLSAACVLILFIIASLISAGALSGGHILSALCFALATLLSAFLAKSKKRARHTHRKRA